MMTNEIEVLLQRINRSWLDGRPQEMKPLLHPEIVMVFPGFRGRSHGADALIAGFSDFCTNATLEEYEESDLSVDLVGGSAVASDVFEMVYEREGRRYATSGRDLWVFIREGDEWRATWRMMSDAEEREL